MAAIDLAPRAPGRWRARAHAAQLRIGAAILIVHLAIAVFGPFLVPYGYSQMGTGAPLSGMSWQHPRRGPARPRRVQPRRPRRAHRHSAVALGTALGLAIGAALGLVSGYVGGWIDNLIQRLLETSSASRSCRAGAARHRVGRPGTVRPSAPRRAGRRLVYAPRIARMARVAAIDISTRDFVTARGCAARARGRSRREILPNASSVLLVEFALRAGYAPVLIGSLGFSASGCGRQRPNGA